YANRALAILAAERRRDCDLLDRDQRGERNERTIGSFYEQILQVGGIVDWASAGFHLYLDDVIVDEEVSRLLVVDHRVDQARYRRDRHAELRRGLAVYANRELRLRRVIVGAHTSKIWKRLHLI